MPALVPTLAPPRPWAGSYGPLPSRLADLVVHPDGRRVVGVDADGVVAVWDLADGRALATFPSPIAAIEADEVRGLSLAMHPDGERLLLFLSIVDGSAEVIYDLARGVVLDRYEDDFLPAAFLGRTLAASYDLVRLRVFDLATRRIWRELAWPTRENRWVAGAIGEHLLVRTAGGAELWHALAGELAWRASAAEAGGVAVAPACDATLLVRAGDFELRDLRGRTIQRVACPALADASAEDLASARIDAALRTLLIHRHDAEAYEAIDLETGAVRARVAAPRYARARFAHDSRFVVVETGASHLVWDVLTGREVLRAPHELEVAVDGLHAIVRDDHYLRRVALASGGYAPRTARDGWVALAVSPRGLVGLGPTGRVQVCDRGGAVRATHQLGPEAFGHARALGGDVAAAIDGRIAIVDAVTGAVARAIEGGGTSLALSPDGLVVAAAAGATVRTWSTVGAEAPARFGVRGGAASVLAIEAAGRRLAVQTATPRRAAEPADGVAIELWRGGTSPLRQHTFRSRTPATCAAFDPSRRWLVSGHLDGAVLVRDTQARAHHATLAAHATAIVGLALHPAGPLVATAGADGSVALHDFAAAGALAHWRGDLAVRALAWLDAAALACATDYGLLVLALR